MANIKFLNIACFTAALLGAGALTAPAGAHGPDVRAPQVVVSDLGGGKTLYVVPYSHLDTQWRWTYRTTITEYLRDTLEENFELFEKYPEYNFNFTGSRRYEMMKEYYPEQYEKLKEYIAQDRWFPIGASVDECDANVPSPESIIRHVLYGNQYFKEEFGRESVDFMLPDCFGFPASLPSVLAHCGLKGFHTQKLDWGSAVGKPFRIGVWVGPDGKGVVGMIDPGPYSSEITTDLSGDEKYLNNIAKVTEVSGISADYRYYGRGDVGGAPHEPSVKKLIESMAADGPIRVLSTRSDQLFIDLTSEQVEKLPRYQGDLLLTQHSAGSITSQAYVKRWNRKSELLADSAERACAAAAWMKNSKYPGELFRQAWYLILGTQMHDILPGTSIPEAYELSWNDQVLALNLLASALEQGVGAVAARMDTRVEGKPLVVYNPLGLRRQDVVEATVEFDVEPAAVAVYNGMGEEVPSQIIKRDGRNVTLLLLADVPSVSFTVFDVRAVSETSPLKSAVTVSERKIENKRYRVTINDAGDVASVYDKQAKCELLAAPMRLAFIEDSPAQWPAWNMDWDDLQREPRAYVDGPATIKIVEEGPIRAAIEITREAQGSTFTQRVNLGVNDRIEVENIIDWRTRESCLKAVFSLNVANSHATYDLGLGTIERENNNEKKYEVPSHQWFDLTDKSGSYGVAVLNDSKYGSDKPGDNLLRLTLLRTPRCTSYHDQGTQDIGRHRIVYALQGHSGDWRKGGVVREAAQLNQPMMAFQTAPHEGPFGKAFSFLRLNDEQTMVKAIKKAENDDRLIVRLQETSGQGPRRIKLLAGVGIAEAIEMDGQEREIGPANITEGELAFDIEPYGIHTFALRLVTGESPAEQPSQPLALPYNVDVVSLDRESKSGAFDNKGNSIPGELLPEELELGGIAFKFGPRDRSASNAVACDGQTIELPAGNWTHLSVLAAAAGADTDADIVVGEKAHNIRVQNWGGFIGQWDNRIWKTPADIHGLQAGYIKRQPVAWYASHQHNAAGENIPYTYSYLFKYDIPISLGARTVTLPKDRNVLVLAASISMSSNGVRPAAPLYDELQQHSEPPIIIPAGGEYQDSMTVAIARPWYSDYAKLRYTLDGSQPSSESPLFTGSIWLDQSATVTAAAFDDLGNHGPMAVSVIEVDDRTPPLLKQATAAVGAAEVELQFSEPVVVEANNAGPHFELSNGSKVIAAHNAENPCIVILSLDTPLAANGEATIDVSGIRDRSKAANVIAGKTVSIETYSPGLVVDYDHLDELGAENVGGVIVDSPVGKAVRLDGNRHFIKIPNAIELSPTEQITLTAWIRPENWQAKGNSRILQKGHTDNQYNISRLGNNLLFDLSGVARITTPLPANGEWHFIAATYDGKSIRLYIDGEEKNAQPAAGKLALTADPFFIGTKHDSAPTGDDFLGEIGPITVWNRALTANHLRAMAIKK